MRSIFRSILLALALVSPATAQNVTTYVGPDGSPVRVSATNPLPTTGAGGGGGGSVPTGTAGSPNASVVTVQGITNGTPLSSVAQDMAPVTTTSASAVNAILFTADVTGYPGGISLQLGGTFVATVTIEYSDDNTNFFATGNSMIGGGIFSGSQSPSVNLVPALHRYVRARVTAYTSGTITSVAYLRAAMPLPSISATLAGSGATIGNNLRAIYWSETTTALTTSQTINGLTRDTGTGTTVAQPWNVFTCFFLADQASAANGAQLQGSLDGTTWFVKLQQALVANTPLRLTDRVDVRYHRCVLTNGTTAQTSLRINSGYGE